MNKKLKDIIYFLCKFYPKELTRTILVKLVYLTDVEFYKKYLRQTTGLIYKYDQYGAFTWDIIDATHELYPEFLKVEETTTPYGEKKYVYHTTDSTYEFTNLDDYTKDVLKLVLEKYSSFSLEDLLDYVYTNPPLNCFKKGENLDFSKWIPNNQLHCHTKINVEKTQRDLITVLKERYKGKLPPFTKNDLEDEEKDKLNKVIAKDILKLTDLKE
jgi:hypothetical protein